MKFTDYLAELENDQEYQQTLKELQAHFALGDAMIKARIRKGISQAELAEMVGTKQANISRIESALGNPTLKLINRIINALEIQIELKVPSATNSFKSIPLPSIRVDNWPQKSATSKSNASQSVGSLK